MHRKFTKEGPFAPFSPWEHLAQVRHARKTRERSPRVHRATETSPVSQALVCVCTAACEHSHSHEEPSCDRFPASRTSRLPLRTIISVAPLELRYSQNVICTASRSMHAFGTGCFLLGMIQVVAPMSGSFRFLVTVFRGTDVTQLNHPAR